MTPTTQNWSDTAADLRTPNEKLWDAVPEGVTNALGAAAIADRAGVGCDRRSAGTKLTAMFNGGYGALGLAFYFAGGEGSQRMWWRCPRG